MNHRTVAAVGVPAAICFAAGAAFAGPPSMSDIVGRQLGVHSTFYDATLGNGWQRMDLLTNTSVDWTVIITSIDTNLLDPEDVGVDDIFGTPNSPPTNLQDAIDAAALAFPSYMSWGANWWPSFNTSEVDWQSLEVLSPGFPISLEPGQTVELLTRSHNSVLGQVFNTANDHGELLIGFIYNGSVVPVGGSIGACCMSDGSCTEIQELDCTSADGNYEGDLSLCEPGLCPAPTGACCVIDGSCSEQTEVDCTNSGGTYEGNGSACAPGLCPQPTGACCLADESCVEVTASDCTDQAGTYDGDFSTCTPELCVAACPGDVTGDGITNIADLVQVIIDWNCGTEFGADPPCVGDATGDRMTNVQDIVFIITNWNCGFVPP